MSRGLNIGSMDKRVLIEQYNVQQLLPSGQKKKDWETVCVFWCSLTEDVSTESPANNQFVNTKRYTLRGRYTSGLKSTMRVNDNGIFYNIVGVRTVGRNEQTIITVEYKDNDQSNI